MKAKSCGTCIMLGVLDNVRIIIVLLAMLFSFPLMSHAHVMTSDDYKVGIIKSTQTIKSNPNDSEAYFRRGCDYAGLKMDDLALADLNKAIDINLQQTYTSNGPAYKQSTKYILTTVGSYRMIAIIYKSGGNIDKAIENYTKAIEVYEQIKPNNIDLQTFYTNLLADRADIYTKQSKYDLAVTDLTTAINNMKDYKNVYVAKRAKVYYLMGEYEKAIEDYNSSIIYNEYWARTIKDRGDAYTKIGEYNKALDDYNTALNFRIFSSALIGRANIYSYYGQTENAIADYTSAIEKCEKAFELNASLFMPIYETECAQAYYLRAKLYFEQGEYLYALKDCNKAIKLKPDYTDALQLKQLSIERL